MKTMPKISMMLLGALAATSACADEIFTYKTSPDGYSYIELNHDVDSFSFEVSGYGSTFYDGRISYFTFSGDESPAASAFNTKTETSLKWTSTGLKRVETVVPTTAKAVDGATRIERGDRSPVTFENLKAGDKIGFSLYDTDGKYVNQFDWNFEDLAENGTEATAFFSPYAADVANVGYHNAVHAFLNYGFHFDDLVTIKSFYVNGNSIASVGNDWGGFEAAYGGGDGQVSGAPLPGALAMFLLGGLGVGALKLKKQRV